MRSLMLSASLLLATAALAQSDPLDITAQEKSACAIDAARFCASTYPDEMSLLGCMKANRALLSHTCLRAFDTGIKRRGL